MVYVGIGQSEIGLTWQLSIDTTKAHRLFLHGWHCHCIGICALFNLDDCKENPKARQNGYRSCFLTFGCAHIVCAGASGVQSSSHNINISRRISLYLETSYTKAKACLKAIVQTSALRYEVHRETLTLRPVHENFGDQVTGNKLWWNIWTVGGLDHSPWLNLTRYTIFGCRNDRACESLDIYNRCNRGKFQRSWCLDWGSPDVAFVWLKLQIFFVWLKDVNSYFRTFSFHGLTFQTIWAYRLFWDKGLSRF